MPQKQRHCLTIWQFSHPFCQVSVDVMWLMPVSEGYRYFLLIGGQFKKRYEAAGMTNQEAQTVVRALVELWRTIFGCPVNLHCDMGTNFMSELLSHLFWIPNVGKTSATPFHFDGIEKIERANKTLKEIITVFVDKDQHEWKSYFQLLMMPYSSLSMQ